MGSPLGHAVSRRERIQRLQIGVRFAADVVPLPLEKDPIHPMLLPQLVKSGREVERLLAEGRGEKNIQRLLQNIVECRK